MNVQVVEADLRDPVHQEAIRRLIDGYAADPMGNGKKLSAEVLERLIPGLQSHPASYVVLAFLGADAVGVAVCFVGFSTFAGRPLINVHDLAVEPAQRGRGVGRRLLDRVEERARQLGCSKLTLEVRSDNEPAKGLYRSFGFGDFGFGGGPQRVLFQEKTLGA